MEEQVLRDRHATFDTTPDVGASIASVLGAAKQTTKYELLASINGLHYNPQQHQQHEKKPSFNRYAVACALLASMNSILLGYDVGVISGAVLFIKEDLHISEFQEEVLVSALSLVSLVGGAVAGRLADALGRRWTMALAACVFLVGALVMGLAPSFSILMVGRVFAGFGVGLALMVAPVYTAEVAPASSRGSLVSLPEIFINLGILLGYVSNYAFSGLPVHLAWRVMLGLGIVPALSLAVGVVFMPESPRWLVMQSRIDEARMVVTRTSSDPVEAEQRLVDIMEAAGLVNNNGEAYERAGNSGQNVWRELLWPSPAVRRMLAVSSGIQFFQQATGIDATVYYSPEAFKSAGIASKSGVIAGTVAMGFTKCLFILVAIIYLDRVGRRPLLLASTIGITCSLVSIALAFFFIEGKGESSMVEASGAGGSVGLLAIFIIFAVCCYVAFFSIGMGPICWVLTTEIFPLRLRAQAMSMGIVINRLSSSIVSLTFLSMARAMTFTGTYCLFTGVSVCSVVFVFFCIPETKGKTLEEVSKFFYRDDSYSLELGNRALVGGDEEGEDKHLNVSQNSEAWAYHEDETIAIGLGPHSNGYSFNKKDLAAKVKAIANKSVSIDFQKTTQQ